MKRSLTRYCRIGIAVGSLAALAVTGCSSKRKTAPMPPAGAANNSQNITGSVSDPSLDDLNADEANLANLGFVMKKAVDGNGKAYYEMDPTMQKADVKQEDLINGLDRYKQDLESFILKRPNDPSINDLKAKLDCIKKYLSVLTDPNSSYWGSGANGKSGSSVQKGSLPPASGGNAGDQNVPSVGTTPTSPPSTSWPGPAPQQSAPCQSSDGCPSVQQQGQGSGSVSQGKPTGSGQEAALAGVASAEQGLSSVGLVYDVKVVPARRDPSKQDYAAGFREETYREYAKAHPNWRSEMISALKNYQQTASAYLSQYRDPQSDRDSVIAAKEREASKVISVLSSSSGS